MHKQNGPFVHVCYHGTRSTEIFDRFRLSTTGAQGPGIYLADRFEAGAQYGAGEMVIQAKVALQSPFYFYPSDESLDALANPELLERVLDFSTHQRVLDRMEREGMDGYGFEVMESLRARGHDGIVMVYPYGDSVISQIERAGVVIAFDPEQVQILHRAPADDPCWQDRIRLTERLEDPTKLDAAKDLRDFVEKRFGSDEAIGVWYLDDDGVTQYTLHEGSAIWHCLGDDAPGMTSMMPDGSSATVCTNYAVHVGRAFPERTQIFGFANTNNPTSRVAREEIHPGGHDFAVVDDRFLVDPWIRLVAAEGDQIFFDLEDEKDAVLVRDIYGPRECWEHMLLAEQAYRPPVPTHENTRSSATAEPSFDF